MMLGPPPSALPPSLLSLRDEILRRKIGHLAHEPDLVSGDHTHVADGHRVPLKLEVLAEAHGVALQLDLVEDHVARLAGHLGLRRADERGTILLEDEDVLLLADLGVELRAPGTDRALRGGDARREGE